MKAVIAHLKNGGTLRAPGFRSHTWLMDRGSLGKEYFTNDLIQRMKNLGYLTYRDDEGNHLGTLRPTVEALKK